MLDLERTLGVIEGVVCYRDHADDDLVYYLPNAVAPRLRGDGTADVGMQVFLQDRAEVSRAEVDDDELAGAILQIGARCHVPAETLAALRRRLTRDHGIREPRLSLPPWREGSVDLLLFDRIGSGGNGSGNNGSGGDSSGAGPDAMVRRIVGARRPSLQSPELEAIFNARLDKRGAALAAAALQGDAGAAGGVLYELAFAGLSPSAEVVITANLDRCVQAITAKLGVNAVYVGVEVGTTLQQLTEEGVIDVKRTTFSDDPGVRKAIDDAVADFQERVMRELFRPTVPAVPPAGALPGGMPAPQGSIVTLSAHYTRTDQNREIRMDYRERAATRQLHTPQGHLAAFGQTREAPVQWVGLSSAWTSMQVAADAGLSFQDDPDLRQVELLLWRLDAGALPAGQARRDGLRMPPQARPLAELAFTPDDPGPLHVSWSIGPDDSPRFYWQARFHHAAGALLPPGSSTWTPPRETGAEQLDVIAAVLQPQVTATFELGAGQPDDLRTVTLELEVRDTESDAVLQRGLLSLSPDRPASSWAYRAPPGVAAELFYTALHSYADGRELQMPRQLVRARNPRVASPFARTLGLTAMLIAPPDGLIEAILDVTYDTRTPQPYRHRVTARLNPGNGFRSDAQVPVLAREDRVSWEAVGFFDDGSMRQLQKGSSAGGSLFIRPSDERPIAVHWVGPAPQEEHLAWVRVIFLQRLSDGTQGERETVEFRGARPPADQRISVPTEGQILFQIERRFLDGHVERVEPRPLDGDSLTVGNRV